MAWLGAPDARRPYPLVCRHWLALFLTYERVLDVRVVVHTGKDRGDATQAFDDACQVSGVAPPESMAIACGSDRRECALDTTGGGGDLSVLPTVSERGFLLPPRAPHACPACARRFPSLAARGTHLRSRCWRPPEPRRRKRSRT